ncbi:hypothetical protein TrVFT333_000069 [Trichoderma virens FT-333]|nr:hypothetical protein TrVFT333_000069 [Trichoderma virens FT-333]
MASPSFSIYRFDEDALKRFIKQRVNYSMILCVAETALNVIKCGPNNTLPPLATFTSYLVSSSDISVLTFMSTLVYFNRLKSTISPAIRDAYEFAFTSSDINNIERHLLSLLRYDLKITEDDLYRELHVFLKPLCIKFAGEFTRKKRHRQKKQRNLPFKLHQLIDVTSGPYPKLVAEAVKPGPTDLEAFLPLFTLKGLRVVTFSLCFSVNPGVVDSSFRVPVGKPRDFLLAFKPDVFWVHVIVILKDKVAIIIAKGDTLIHAVEPTLKALNSPFWCAAKLAPKVFFNILPFKPFVIAAFYATFYAAFYAAFYATFYITLRSLQQSLSKEEWLAKSYVQSSTKDGWKGEIL